MKEDTSTNLRQVIPWTLFTGKMILPLFLIIVFCSMTNNFLIIRLCTCYIRNY